MASARPINTLPSAEECYPPPPYTESASTLDEAIPAIDESNNQSESNIGNSRSNLHSTPPPSYAPPIPPRASDLRELPFVSLIHQPPPPVYENTPGSQSTLRSFDEEPYQRRSQQVFTISTETPTNAQVLIRFGPSGPFDPSLPPGQPQRSRDYQRQSSRRKLHWHECLKWLLLLQSVFGFLLLNFGISCIVMSHDGSGSGSGAGDVERMCSDGSGIWGGLVSLTSGIIGLWALNTRKQGLITAHMVLAILASICSGINLIFSSIWADAAGRNYYYVSGGGYYREFSVNESLKVINILACLISFFNLLVCAATSTLMGCNAVLCRTTLTRSSRVHSAATAATQQVPAS